MDLIDAAKTNNLEHVRLLVEQGADKDKGDGIGKTPLWWASKNGHLEVAQYLVEQGAAMEKANNISITPLSVAAQNGHLEVVRYLLEQGADRDKANLDGWTPLHWAAACGYLEIAMLLMSYGTDLNARTNSGNLPIDAKSPDVAWTTATSEPPSKTDIPTQLHQLRYSRKMKKKMVRSRSTSDHGLMRGQQQQQ